MELVAQGIVQVIVYLVTEGMVDRLISQGSRIGVRLQARRCVIVAWFAINIDCTAIVVPPLSLFHNHDLIAVVYEK